MLTTFRIAVKTILFLTLSLVGSIPLFSRTVVYYNGKIFTSDTLHPFIQYFVVENGKIVETGDTLSDARVNRYDRRVDLRKKTVIPGIIDSHIHFVDGALGMMQISFFDVADSGMLRRRIRETGNQLLDGMYIGRDLGYEPLKNIVSPLRFLDEQLPGIPAIIFLKSGHAAVANSAAMDMLGFSPSTIISDGTVQIDQDGMMTGYLLEAASMEASKITGSLYSAATIEEAIIRAQSKALSYGITTIGDNTFSPFHYKIFQEMAKENMLTMRVRARSYGRIPVTESLMKQLGRKKLGFIGTAVDPDVVGYHAMKFFVDMSLSVPANAVTAVKPGGEVFLSRDALKDIFLLHPHSPMAFHVQGKEGLENILTTLEQVGTRRDPNRHVIDHAGYCSRDEMKRMRDLGLCTTIIAGQIFDYDALASYYRSASGKYGIDFKEDNLLNARDKYHIVRAALTSDYPYGMDTMFVRYKHIDGLNPFPMMAAIVTGTFPDGTPISGVGEKTLTLPEAVTAYTANGAYVVEAEDHLGTIAVGYDADFVVLTEDIFSGDPINIYNASAANTYIAGAEVYTREKSSVLSGMKTIDVVPREYAVSPILGYDPSLGLIFGGAVFVFPLNTPGQSFDLQLQALQSGNITLNADYAYLDLLHNATFSVSGSYSTFFQYYFGEGDETHARGYRKLFARRFRIAPDLEYPFAPDWKLGVYADARGITETKVTDEHDVALPVSLAPSQTTVAPGIAIHFDTRDNPYSTKKGWYARAFVHSISGAGRVLQFGGEIRDFMYIYNARYILGGRILAGFSSGNPSYMFRYTLGGSSLLRGYFDNRFRGRKFFAAQIESRFSVRGRLSGVLFADAGDIADTAFHTVLSTVGAGIRFALNDQTNLRLDYGIAKDQSGVFFTFGESF